MFMNLVKCADRFLKPRHCFTPLGKVGEKSKTRHTHADVVRKLLFFYVGLFHHVGRLVGAAAQKTRHTHRHEQEGDDHGRDGINLWKGD